MAVHNDVGIKGEQLATDYLLLKGYEVIEKNWRCGKAEVDIIVLKDSCVVFVEVKCRSSVSFGEPETFVSEKKQTMLIEAADRYMQEMPEAYEVRFDIVSVVLKDSKPVINHIIQAFGPRW